MSSDLTHLNLEAPELELLWATPIIKRRLNAPPEFNADLSETLLTLRAQDNRPRGRSNYGGWQSEQTLFELDDPNLRALHEACAQSVADLIVQCGRARPDQDIGVRLYAWANVLDRGGYNVYHTHPNNDLSGVYYVDAGEADPANAKSGVVCFYDPRSAAGMMATPFMGFNEDCEFSPESGMLILFPSYLGHSVHAYTGARPRIAVGFNAVVEAE